MLFCILGRKRYEGIVTIRHPMTPELELKMGEAIPTAPGVRSPMGYRITLKPNTSQLPPQSIGGHHGPIRNPVQTGGNDLFNLFFREKSQDGLSAGSGMDGQLSPDGDVVANRLVTLHLVGENNFA